MKRRTVIFILLMLAIVGTVTYVRTRTPIAEEVWMPEGVATSTLATAYMAGGCFWCVEADFEKLSGVAEAVSGYMGGDVANPTYDMVSSGETGHREVVRIRYNPERVSYAELILHLLSHSDPTDADGSFYDRGFQYTSAVYYSSEREKEIAETVIADIEAKNIFDKPVATQVERASVFYEAEEYHQDYYKKNPIRYSYYRNGSGRDDFIESVWGSVSYTLPVGLISTSTPSRFWELFEKPSDEALREQLSDIAYHVTQRDATEPAFDNPFNDHGEEGIYVDVLSGEPLFSSTHKYDSGTGWPSFWRPITDETIVHRKDYVLGFPRTEVRSYYADSHLGHVFEDGPNVLPNGTPATGLRYCMNSAALRFVPRGEMEREGYADFLYLFE